MSKFKIGDKVRLVRAVDMAARVGATATVKGENSPWVIVEWDVNEKSGRQCDGSYSPSSFELVANDNSPVRTVTRREIVPGAYGIVNLSRPAKPMLLPKARDYTTGELRAAATLFNELADVLDENAREAA